VPVQVYGDRNSTHLPTSALRQSISAARRALRLVGNHRVTRMPRRQRINTRLSASVELRVSITRAIAPGGMGAQLGAVVDVELPEDVGQAGLDLSSEMNILSPIWRLVSPWETNSASLASVGVSDSEPAGRRIGPRAPRAHSSASSVLSSAPSARAVVGVLAERFSKLAVDGCPVFFLGRHADGADPRAGAVAGGE
jgi:hypothetical protein